MPWGYQPSFHYDAKASKYERQAGCEGDDFLWLRDKSMPIGWRRVTSAEFDAAQVPNDDKGTGNIHSTVKPVGAGDDDGLMRWLVRLITPPGGRVGDITIGSGSTAIAAQIESHAFVGCDIDPGAVHIAQARCAYWTPERHREELAGTIARREAVRKKAEAERAAAEARGQLDIFGAKR
jgi:site-specific DNA-methyltransferase (adenine-specific)